MSDIVTKLDNTEEPLLRLEDLSIDYRIRNGYLSAVSDVNFTMNRGEIVALVGESGCGKSVLTKTFAGMLDGNGFIDKGEIVFNDDSLTNICAPMNKAAEVIIRQARRKLDEYSQSLDLLIQRIDFLVQFPDFRPLPAAVPC